MPRYAWTLALALCLPTLVFAAPTPSVQVVTAEAALLPLSSNPRDVAARLTSASATSPGVVARLASVKDPSSWLTSRLHASVDEKRGTITVRLVGCSSKDAV